MEYVYFKLLFNPLGQEKNIQVFIKIDNIEDGTEFYNGYSIFNIAPDWDSAWSGVGLQNNEKWKTGLYKYTLRIGSRSTYEGSFSVY